MRPFAGNAENKAVNVGVERPAASGETAHRQAGFVVHAEDGADVAQGASADQTFRTAEVLFCRLKQDPHPAIQRGFTRFKF
ncbi:hypothetical protein D3C78_1803860 [compost metagenome]